MEVTVQVDDCTLQGTLLHSLSLQLPVEAVSARELIRRYVLRNLEEQRTAPATPSYRLFAPAAEEAVLNGSDRPTAPEIDAERQCELALNAFQRNGFLLLVDDQQIVELDDSFVITSLSIIQFLRLTPLIGG